MTISAKIIADSISPDKIRLVSMQLRYPRFIHAELMTHRVFSRNASSSRAVPVAKLIEDIKRDTAMPIHWGKNQKGMQADGECNEAVYIPTIFSETNNLAKGTHFATDKISHEQAWETARNYAIVVALAYNEAGYHKQIVNRLLEPFSHINVVVTSTYWANWFKLRYHKDAMPEICELAKQMKSAMDQSTTRLLLPGEWHLPYVQEENVDYTEGDQTNWIKVSVARCARVSYLTYEGKEPDIEADLKLYERLVGSEPLHASPAEHQATPDERWFQSLGSSQWSWRHSIEHGNFYGWRQYRKTLKGEFENEYAI